MPHRWLTTFHASPIADADNPFVCRAPNAIAGACLAATSVKVGDPNSPRCRLRPVRSESRRIACRSTRSSQPIGCFWRRWRVQPPRRWPWQCARAAQPTPSPAQPAHRDTGPESRNSATSRRASVGSSSMSRLGKEPTAIRCAKVANCAARIGSDDVSAGGQPPTRRLRPRWSSRRLCALGRARTDASRDRGQEPRGVTWRAKDEIGGRRDLGWHLGPGPNGQRHPMDPPGLTFRAQDGEGECVAHIVAEQLQDAPRLHVIEQRPERLALGHRARRPQLEDAPAGVALEHMIRIEFCSTAALTCAPPGGGYIGRLAIVERHRRRLALDDQPRLPSIRSATPSAKPLGQRRLRC